MSVNQVDNMEEYEDPNLYDEENEIFVEDIPLLLRWAKKQGGPVIDLACGTGRVTIPIALSSIPVIGVDLSEKMLAKAREKVGERNVPITWVQQDCLKLDLDEKVKLVYMTGNSFQHFLTNTTQDELLQSVNRHLLEGGIFIFDTRFPSKEELLQPEKEEYWRTYRNHAGNSVDVYTIASYNPLDQIQHYTTIRRTKQPAGMITERRTHIHLRYTYPQEMKRLLESNGFELLHLYSDWSEQPLSDDSYSMVIVCRSKKS